MFSVWHRNAQFLARCCSTLILRVDKKKTMGDGLMLGYEFEIFCELMGKGTRTLFLSNLYGGMCSLLLWAFVN